MSISGDSVAGEIFITLDNDFVFFCTKITAAQKRTFPQKSETSRGKAYTAHHLIGLHNEVH